MNGGAASRGIGYDVPMPSLVVPMAVVFGRVVRCP